MAKDISMRHTKLKPEEAALIAGEIIKPGWQSKNEGIHERVSFEDTIWGFDLAGGAYYKTPLRVTYVKPDSRAEKANVRAGDFLLRINNIDTTTMTIQEAHDIIVESGINLKLNVTSPEDLDDSFHYYEDPLLEEAALAEKRLADERARRAKWFKPRDGGLKLQWPWVSKRCQIYRESNCFLVPSKYENLHKDKFPVPLPAIRYIDNVILDNMDNERFKLLEEKEKQNSKGENSQVDDNNNSTENITDTGIKNGQVSKENKADNKNDVNDSAEEISIENNKENDETDDINSEDDVESVEESNDYNNEEISSIEDNNATIEENNNFNAIENEIDEVHTQNVSSTEDTISKENGDNNEQNQLEEKSNVEPILEGENDESENGDQDSSEMVESTENNDILENAHEDDANRVDDKDSDLNKSPVTVLVTDMSDVSDESTEDNRNI